MTRVRSQTRLALGTGTGSYDGGRATEITITSETTKAMTRTPSTTSRGRGTRVVGGAVLTLRR